MQVKIAKEKYTIDLKTVLDNKPGHLYTITFTDVSKNNILASGSWDGTVRLHNETTELEAIFFFKEPVEGLRFSPNGKYLAVGIENEIHIYDMNSKKSFKVFPRETAVRGAVFAWSDDSNRLACIFYDNSIHVFDIINQIELGLIEDVPSLGGNMIAWKKDILAVGLNNGQIALYNLNSSVFQLVGYLENHEDIVNAVAFSDVEDDLTLYSVSPDKTFRSWNLETRKGKILYTHETSLLYVSVKQTFSGQMILICSDSENIIFADEQLQASIRLTNSSYCNGVINASADKFIRGINDHDLGIFSLSEQKLVTTLKGKNDQVNSVKMLNQDDLLYGSGDKSIHFINLQNKQEKIIKGHSESISYISVSQDAKYMVSSSYDDTIRLWDIAGQQELKIVTKKAELPSCVLFSEDSKTIYTASGGDFTIRGYTLDGKQLFSESIHEEYVNKLVSFKNGFFSGGDDKKVIFWNNNKGRILIKGDSEITALSVSSNQEMLAFGTNKGTLTIIEIKNGQKKAELKYSRKINCCSFSPDDKFVAFGSHTNLIIHEFETGENYTICSLFEPLKEVFWYFPTTTTPSTDYSRTKLLLISVAREVLSGEFFLTSVQQSEASKIDKLKIITDTQVTKGSLEPENQEIIEEVSELPVEDIQTLKPETDPEPTPMVLEESVPEVEPINLLEKFQEEFESMVSSTKDNDSISDFSANLTKNMSSLELGSLVYKEYMETLKHLDKIQELIEINSEETHEGFKIILNRITRLKPVINEALEEIDFILD